MSKRILRASADRDMDLYTEEDDFESRQYRLRIRQKYRGRKLRHRDIPYSYDPTHEMILEGLGRSIGVLRVPSGRGEEVLFDDVRYAGGYQWHEPTMRDQLGLDHKAFGERAFTTPCVPDVLGNSNTVGHVDSDYRAGLIDYVIDAKDASFLRPTFSPFEPLFRSLVPIPEPPSGSDEACDPRSVLDSLDLITDHATLLHIIDFLKEPSTQFIRTDCQYTSASSAVVMHHWLPKIMYGAGEPHRGWVNSYIRRVTAPSREGAWEGGTTQMVRYDLGGMGVLVRYPMNARLAGTSGVKSEERVTQHRYVYDTKTKSSSKTKAMIGPCPVIDRSKFVAIKVISQHYYSTTVLDLEDLYLRLLLTQTEHCLIAPHHKDDFNQHDRPPRIVSITDPIFDDAKISIEPLLKQAIGLWRGMVMLTRKLGGNVSFVGNENGSMAVIGAKPGGYEHAELSEEALGMLENGAPSDLSHEPKISGYEEFDRRLYTADWVLLNQAQDPLVARWGA